MKQHHPWTPPYGHPNFANPCMPCPPKGPHCDPCDGAWLLPRVIGMGTEHNRCMHTYINIDTIPAGQPPFTVCAIQALTPCQMCERRGCCPNEMLFDVRIPLEITLRDACGRLVRACGSMDAKIRIPLRCRRCDAEDYQAYAKACVRLLSAEAICGCGFQACVDLLLEAYVTRLEPYHPCPPKPACPSLPWYPQPYYDLGL